MQTHVHRDTVQTYSAQRCSARAFRRLAGVLALVFVVSAASIAAAQSGMPLDRDAVLRETIEALGVTDAQWIEIEPVTELDDTLIITTTVGDEEVVLDLARHSLRSPRFQVLVQTETGELVQGDIPAVRTYRGSVAGRDATRVAASVTPEGSIDAAIRIGERGFSIEPVASVVPSAPASWHVVYSTRDVLANEDVSCGADLLADHELPRYIERDGEYRGTGIYECEIAFDADREFYNANGNSVPNTIADIEAVMSRVTMIYEDDVSITYVITATIVRTSEPDPYSSTNPSTLLGQFGQEWNTNQNGVQRDVAHLMTGKNIDGSVIGIASLGVICTTRAAYGLSQSRFTSNMASRAALTAHELGHNWASGHCSGNDCRIMCPGLGGCTGDISRFGAASRGAITAHRSTRDCIPEIEEPLPLPFVDTFDAGFIDDTLWSFWVTLSAAEFGKNEPTAPAALNLDSVNEDLHDEIFSKPLLLAGQSNVLLSFFTQERTVTPGDTLIVEYFGSNDQWNLIDAIAANGGEPDFFQFRTYALTGNALHDEFRIRFRSGGDLWSDDWFVDNLSISDSGLAATVTPQSSSVPVGGTLLFDADIQNVSNSSQSSDAWIDVYGPDGGPVFAGGNPKFGPKALSVPQNQSRGRSDLPINIPGSAQPGPGYRVILFIGDFNTKAVQAVGEFTFEVTP